MHQYVFPDWPKVHQNDITTGTHYYPQETVASLPSSAYYYFRKGPSAPRGKTETALYIRLSFSATGHSRW